ASRFGGSHLHRDSSGAVPSGTAPFFLFTAADHVGARVLDPTGPHTTTSTAQTCPASAGSDDRPGYGGARRF
ncbi:MAG: hypothetical protein ACYDAD_15785, partial [Acidimicrobiales bacterium]